MTRRVHSMGNRLRRSILLPSALGMAWLLGGCAGTPAPQLQASAPPPKPPGTIEAYIHEASEKFNMPERWIRAVMQQESGGRTHVHGQPIVSNKGAMGLMQVMPGTWSYLRDAYGLGNDPFDPHDNVIAGTAYLREMFDLYGSPGFLAAYNAGPGRYEFSLKTSRPLPGETRHYVAVIAPKLEGVSPNGPSPTRPARAMDVALRTDAPAHSAFDGDVGTGTAATSPAITTAALVTPAPAAPAPVAPPPEVIRLAALPPVPAPAAVPVPTPVAAPVHVAAVPEPPAPADDTMVFSSSDAPAPVTHAPVAAPHSSHPTPTPVSASAAVPADAHPANGLVHTDRRSNLPPGWYVPVAYSR